MLVTTFTVIFLILASKTTFDKGHIEPSQLPVMLVVSPFDAKNTTLVIEPGTFYTCFIPYVQESYSLRVSITDNRGLQSVQQRDLKYPSVNVFKTEELQRVTFESYASVTGYFTISRTGYCG